MHFVIIGLSHKTATVEIREKLAFSPAEIPAFLTRLVEDECIQESFLLSTCNRVEACVVSPTPEKAAQVAEALLKRELKDLQFYTKTDHEAIQHFFKLTAGLDSMILGEPQISGQVKEAYSQATAAHTTGAYLNKLVHRALSVNKRIRTETEIGRHPVSVSFAAILLAEKIFGSFKKKKVLLLGAGEMGELAAKHLIEREVSEIMITNRTLEKAQEVAKGLAVSSRIIPWEELAQALAASDIVIVSTGAQEFVVTEDLVREAMKKRRNEPMFFIDIAVPRNVDPAVNQLENVYLYDIDHLQNIVQNNLKEREKEALKAETLIQEEVNTFLAQLKERQFSPTIQKLSQKFDHIRRLELEKYLGKLSGLNEKDRELAKEVAEACTKAIVNKILHDPIILMKTEETQEDAPRYSEILKKLFRLDPESDA